MAEILGILEVGKLDQIGKRIRDSIIVSGSNPYYWDPVTVDEAWRQVTSGISEWREYKDNRASLPGGVVERPLYKLPGMQLVGVAFVALKNLDRPDGWKKGMIGMKGQVMGLGIFKN